MKLDSEKQRETLLYCIKNTYFQGTSEALMEALTDIAGDALTDSGGDLSKR